MFKTQANCVYFADEAMETEAAPESTTAESEPANVAEQEPVSAAAAEEEGEAKPSVE